MPINTILPEHRAVPITESPQSNELEEINIDEVFESARERYVESVWEGIRGMTLDHTLAALSRVRVEDTRVKHQAVDLVFDRMFAAAAKENYRLYEEQEELFKDDVRAGVCTALMLSEGGYAVYTATPQETMSGITLFAVKEIEGKSIIYVINAGAYRWEQDDQPLVINPEQTNYADLRIPVRTGRFPKNDRAIRKFLSGDLNYYTEDNRNNIPSRVGIKPSEDTEIIPLYIGLSSGSFQARKQENVDSGHFKDTGEPINSALTDVFCGKIAEQIKRT